MNLFRNASVLIFTSLFLNICFGQEAWKCLNYDGLDEYTTLGNPDELQLEDFTLTLWFYGEDNTKSIITRGESQGAPESRIFDLYGDGTYLQLFVNSSGGIGHLHTIGVYETNQWNHLAIIQSGSKLITLLNGKNPQESEAPFIPNVTDYGWDIGGNSAYSHQGKIDELSIWSTVRSLSLIRDKMHARYTFWGGLESNYRFDESEGAILPDTDSDHDGTNINMEDEDWVSSYLPMGNSIARARIDQRGIWQAVGTDNALDSDGFWLRVDSPLLEENYATYGNENDIRLNSISELDLPMGVVQRYNETWYIDVFGIVNANITFNLNKIWGPNLLAGNVSNYALLYREDEDAAFTELIYDVLIIGGTEVVFQGVPLTDGYYTLGTKNSSSSPIEVELELGESYFGANDYVEYIPGNLPILIVAPHGGALEPGEYPIISDHVGDGGTREGTFIVSDSMKLFTNGCRPHVVINHLKSNRFGGTGDQFQAGGYEPDLHQTWYDYHNFIEMAKTTITDDWGAGHYFEMHSNAHDFDRTEVGLGISGYWLDQPDDILVTKVDNSHVKNLCTAGEADFLEVLKGSNSLGSLLQARGWNSIPSYENPSPIGAPFFFSGRNMWRHGSNSAGVIDASHVENFYQFINWEDNRANYCGDLAASMLTFMATFYEFELDCTLDDSGVEEIAPELFTIFPNPCSRAEKFNFDNSAEINDLKLHDLCGQEVYAPNLMNGTWPQNIEVGIYFIHVYFTNGTKGIKRVVLM